MLYASGSWENISDLFVELNLLHSVFSWKCLLHSYIYIYMSSVFQHAPTTAMFVTTIAPWVMSSVAQTQIALLVMVA